MKFGIMRKRAEITIQRKLGMDASQEQARLVGKYSIPVAEGKMTVDEAVLEIKAQ